MIANPGAHCKLILKINSLDCRLLMRSAFLNQSAHFEVFSSFWLPNLQKGTVLVLLVLTKI